MVEFDAFALNDVAQVFVIGNHDGDVGLELSRVVTIQEVEKAVIVLGNQNHDALAIVDSPHPKPGTKLLDAGIALQQKRKTRRQEYPSVPKLQPVFSAVLL